MIEMEAAFRILSYRVRVVTEDRLGKGPLAVYLNACDRRTRYMLIHDNCRAA